MSANKQLLTISGLGDKANHAIYGASFSLLGTVAFANLATTDISSTYALGFGLACGVFLAGAVEIYDLISGRGTPSFLDFLATISIPALLFAIALLMK